MNFCSYHMNKNQIMFLSEENGEKSTFICKISSPITNAKAYVNLLSLNQVVARITASVADGTIQQL